MTRAALPSTFSRKLVAKIHIYKKTRNFTSLSCKPKSNTTVHRLLSSSTSESTNKISSQTTEQPLRVCTQLSSEPQTRTSSVTPLTFTLQQLILFPSKKNRRNVALSYPADLSRGSYERFGLVLMDKNSVLQRSHRIFSRRLASWPFRLSTRLFVFHCQ